MYATFKQLEERYIKHQDWINNSKECRWANLISKVGYYDDWKERVVIDGVKYSYVYNTIPYDELKSVAIKKAHELGLKIPE